MGKYAKLREKILSGASDANVNFDELCRFLKRMGFSERIKGSHHIFSHDGIPDILNLQPKGGKAKPYQVKQIRRVLTHSPLRNLDVD
ncbi:type II toxin-antitoxin system HicA family toxin [Wenzhouxiangella sediminis]|uniref:Type II toxin-antitoxin system HicA family toxin n=1 Tax=Wenzhouxiangella sediminis TaxID=1792836 RepID=A0A3E1K8L1_9GAMM|nr:type II toxin-antitoxin system HicA family toxin [Wenzhouxiangella sediminis]RFF30360.1 type II toxin-antitoxin system HicA family toxin [Wenzhouxiangella sediminis]